MKDKMRKAYQRKFNKCIRALNKGIANDNLWRGRFIFLQRDEIGRASCRERV